MKRPDFIARQAATALVAACRIKGVDPERVFEDGDGGGMTRTLAAATCVDRLCWHKHFAARVFRISRKRLTPSGLKIAQVREAEKDIVQDAMLKLCPVRPVTAEVIALARPQLAKGADMAFVAECFDVDARDLARACEQEGIAA